MGVVGHLRIGDRVTGAAQSGIINNVSSDTTVAGSPAEPISNMRKSWALLNRLPEIRNRIKRLESQLENLRKLIPGQKSGAEK